MRFMETKRIRLKDLEPNKGQIQGLPANPRKWTREQLARLTASIKQTPELLEARGLLVVEHEGKYIALGGNMRLAALKALKAEEAPCTVLPSGLPPEKLKEIVAKDNSSFGEWDMEALEREWGDLPLDDWGIEVEFGQEPPKDQEPEDDGYDVEAAAARIKEPKTKRGEIYRLGNHLLMCGDATLAEDVEALAAGVMVDLIITDPPYNVDYQGCTADKLKISNDRMPDQAFKAFLLDSFTNMRNQARPGCPIYIFHASWEAVNFITAMVEAGFQHKQQLIWVKNSMTLGRQDYQWQHEPILYGWVEGVAHYFVADRTLRTVIEDRPDFAKMTKAELVEWAEKMTAGVQVPTTVIRGDKPLRNAEHPIMKPVPLIGRLVLNSSRKGDVVMDLFGGSGSTLMACEQTGRRARCMELDPVYCDVIINRWQAWTGALPERIREADNG